MRDLILIRHPVTDLAGTFCGHSDPDLSAVGLAQLYALQRRLDRLPLDQLVSSDLLRTRRCAEALAERHGIDAVLDPGLREIHFGDWEGLRWDEIESRFPEQSQRWVQGFATFTPPHAEPYADFTARITRHVAQWLQDAAPKTLAVVTHRGVLQFVLQTYCGISATWASELSSGYGVALRCARTADADHPLAVRDKWQPD